MFQNKKGFTLIELIVVIAIIAILAAIAVPAFTGLTRQAEEAATEADAKIIAQAINVYTMLHGEINPTISIPKQLADAQLWPQGVHESTPAVNWVTIDANGVATVVKPK